MAFVLRLNPKFRALGPPAHMQEAGLCKARGGSAAVEFAIVGPIFLLMMLGIFSYGGYFLTAHTLQQITNDAARAAIGGLDDDERRELAEQSVRAGVSAQPFMHGRVAEVTVTRSGATMSVAVTYDASEDMYWAARSVVPVPAPQISRSASIRIGGF